jgi:hypothetical protein
MAQSTVPLPSPAGGHPDGFDRVAFLAELGNQVAGFFADQWRWSSALLRSTCLPSRERW